MKTRLVRSFQIALIALFLPATLLHSQSTSTKKAPARKAPVSAPAAVTDAFKKAYPNAQIKNASSENEGGKIEWELVSTDGAVQRTVTYSPDGKRIETEEVIAATQLPKAVSDALAAKYPKTPLVSAEKVASAAGVITYEVVINQGGKKKAVTIDPTGKIKL